MLIFFAAIPQPNASLPLAEVAYFRLHLPRDLLLRPIGSRHEAIQFAQFQKPADRADAARAGLRENEVGGNHQAVQKKPVRPDFQKKAITSGSASIVALRESQYWSVVRGRL